MNPKKTAIAYAISHRGLSDAPRSVADWPKKSVVPLARETIQSGALVEAEESFTAPFVAGLRIEQRAAISAPC